MPRWIPLESNPEVLNEVAKNLGLDTSKHQFTDVYGLDPDLLAMVPKPVKAVLMCFPITEESEAAARQEDAEKKDAAPPGSEALFYMKQTISNACGTIAVLHSAANNTADLSIEPGSFLASFLTATKGMGAEERGRYLEEPPAGAVNIEVIHQAAAAKGDTAVPKEDEVVNLHFVAFVQDGGQLWQLDGRRSGPVCHGPSSPTTLLDDAVVVVKHFIERASSINFNLLALTATPAE